MSLFEDLTPDISYDIVRDLLSEYREHSTQEIAEWEALYNNATSPFLPRTMDRLSVEYRKQAWTPIAYAKMIVDAWAAGLYGRQGPVERSTGVEEWDAKMPWPQMPRLMLRVARVASITGNDVIRLRPGFPDKIIYADMGPGNAVAITDPQDPHGDIIGVVYDYMADTVEAQVSRYSHGNKQAQHVVEIVTRHVRDASGDIIIPGIHRKFVDDELVPQDDEGYNPLGDYLDCVWWRNKDHPTDANGASDVEPLFRLFKALNETYTDLQELGKWNLWPMLVTNTVGRPEISYTPRAIVQLAEETADGKAPDLKRLDWGGNVLYPFIKYVENLTMVMHQTSKVPSVAVGDLKNISQLSSGRALEVTMQPYLSELGERERVAIEQEKQLMETTVAMMAYSDIIKGVSGPDMKAIRAKMEPSVTFPPYRLPKNYNDEASRHVQLRGAGLITLKRSLEERYPDWTDDEIAEELEQLRPDEPEVQDAANINRIKAAQERIRNAEQE